MPNQQNQNIQQPGLMSGDEFATAIKKKYPAYASEDNRELVQAVVKKYPVYAQSLKPGWDQTGGVSGSWEPESDLHKAFLGPGTAMGAKAPEGWYDISKEPFHVVPGGLAEHVIQFFDPSFKGGATQEMQAPTALQLPLVDAAQFVDVQKHPRLKAATEFAQGMTSPENVALTVATGAFGLTKNPVLIGAASRWLSAGFTAQMFKSAYDSNIKYREALQNGDEAAAKYYETQMGLSAGMGALAGKHAIAGEPVPSMRALSKKYSAEAAQGQPVEWLDSTRPNHPQVVPDANAHSVPQTVTTSDVDATKLVKDSLKDSATVPATETRPTTFNTTQPPAASESIESLTARIRQLESQVANPDATPEVKIAAKSQSDAVREQRDQAIPTVSDDIQTPGGTPYYERTNAAEYRTEEEQKAYDAQQHELAERRVLRAAEIQRVNELADQIRAKLGVKSLESSVTEAAPSQPPVTQAPQPTLEVAAPKRSLLPVISDALRSEDSNRARQLLIQHIKSSTPEELEFSKEQLSKNAAGFQAQADAARSAKARMDKNREVAQAMTEAKGARGGYTFSTDPDTGETKVTGKFPYEAQHYSRALIAELMGKERPAGQGVDDIVPKAPPKGVSQSDWDKVIAFNVQERQALKDDITEGWRQWRENHDENLLSAIKDHMRELDRMTYEYFDPKVNEDMASTGNLAYKPPIEGPNGELRPASEFQPVTREVANKIFGRKLAKNPTPFEFEQLANQAERQSKQFTKAAQLLQAAVDRQKNQRGFIGEAQLPNVDAVVKSAKRLNFKVTELTGNNRPPSTGWVSPNGSHVIHVDPHNMETHDVTAGTILGGIDGKVATDRFLKAGWIRMVEPQLFQFHQPRPRVFDALENVLIRNGRYGWELGFNYVDHKGLTRYADIAAGWADTGNIKEAFQKAYPGEIIPHDETGAIPGWQSMAGMTVGGLLGAHFGYPGLVTGMGIGMVTPALLKSDVVMRGVDTLRPIINAAKINIRTFFHGTDDGPSVSKAMQAIRDEQRQNLQVPEQTLGSRISQIPGNIWHYLDPLAFITDRPNAIQKWTMAEDARGKAFRDAEGKFSIDESPYAGVVAAITGIRGAVSSARSMISAIERDAKVVGLHGQTTDYLNLTAYRRTYQNLMEHAQDIIQAVDTNQKRLAVSQNPLERIELQDRIREDVGVLKKIRVKFEKGTAVPGGYTPETIERDINLLREQLGPQRFKQVSDLAERLWKVNRQTLDLIRDDANGGKQGIISQELYDKFVARGNEYIPMRRILETAANDNLKVYGKQSPLYLRQQNVIHSMEGSELVNVDPWQASVNGMAESIREVYRNKVLGQFLDVAKTDRGIAKYFRPVMPEKDSEAPRIKQKPGPGEKEIAHYEDGKKVAYIVPEWLANSLDTSSVMQARTISNVILRATNSIFKTAATVYNPFWTATRLIPTLAGRAFLTDNGPKQPLPMIAAQFAKAVRSAWTHDDEWMEFARTGLARNTMMRMLYPEGDLTSEKLGLKGPLAHPTHVLTTMRALSDLPTDITNFNHWKRLRLGGYSEKAATFLTQTRGPLPDYAQMGAGDTPLSVAFTFLRADWAHIRSTLALASDKDFRPALIHAGLAFGVLTMAAVANNLSAVNSKGQALWPRVHDSDKEKYFIVLTHTEDANGRPGMIKIPKPDFISKLFNPMEDAMYETMSKHVKGAQDPRSWKDIFANTAARFIPGQPQFNTDKPAATQIPEALGATAWQQLNPAGRVPAEELLNRQLSFNRLSNIVPERQNNVPTLTTELQGLGRSNVSPLSMELGQRLGVSPQRIEHIGRGTLGPGMSLLEGMSGPFLHGSQQARTQGVTNQDFRGQDELTLERKIYDKVEKFAPYYTTFRQLEKSQDPRAEAFKRRYSTAIINGHMSELMDKRLADLQAKQRLIEQDPKLDDSFRANTLHAIHDAKMTLLHSYYDMLNTEPGIKPVEVGSMGGRTSK